MSSSSRSSSIVSDINVSKRDRSEEHGHEGGEEVGVKAKKKVVRIQKACLVCRATKMKCIGGLNPPCVRCIRDKVDCVFVESRRGRQPKKKLQSQPQSTIPIDPMILPPLPLPPLTRPKKRIKRSPSPPPQNHKYSTDHPLGVLAAAASGIELADNENGEEDDVGIANNRYFSHHPERGGRKGGVPEAKGLLDEEEVGELWEVFFGKIHVHSPTIQASIATPEWVASKSCTLFNAICCISARYHPTKSTNLCSRLRALTKKELEKFPTEKSLECVQAQLLYCAYALIPPESLETDVTWLRVGITLRLAIDMNLHRGKAFWGSSVDEGRMKSMQRTWLATMTTDRTICAQLGKPSLSWTQTDTTFVEQSTDSPDDRRVFAQVELSQMLAASLEEMRNHSNLHRKPGELPDLAIKFERKLDDWREKWVDRVVLGPLSDEQQAIRQARIKLYSHNAHLMVASVILQLAVSNDKDGYAAFALAKFQTAALALLHTFLDEMVAPGFSPYCTDFHFGFVLYGALSLLKSVQSQFRHCLVDKTTAGKLINATADGLEQAACSWDHLPFLQSKFLRRVLRARLPDYQVPPRTSPLPARLQAPFTSSTSCQPLPSRITSSETIDVGRIAAGSSSSRSDGEDPTLAPAIPEDASVFNYDFDDGGAAEIETQFFDSSVMDFISWPDFWMGGPSLTGVYSRAPSRAASPTLA